MPTVTELRKQCKAKGVKGYSKWKKAELQKACGGKIPTKKRSPKIPSRASRDKACNPAKKPGPHHVCNPQTGRWCKAGGAVANRLVAQHMDRAIVAGGSGSLAKELREFKRIEAELAKF